MNRTGGWHICEEADLEPLVQFLLKREWAWTAFTSRLLNGDRPKFPKSTFATILIDSDTVGIRGALYLSRHGLLLPALDTGNLQRNSENGNTLAALLQNRRVHTIMGTASDVTCMSQFINGSLRARVEYHLMKLEARPAREYRLPGHEYRQATHRDLRRLMPLQAAYEKEEVLLDPSKHNSALTRTNLLHALKEQLIVVLSRKTDTTDQPVAKAGTNARGILYWQIGGVYTERKYRCRGIGGSVVDFLLYCIFTEGKRACLFVKKDNAAAIAMYRRLGFETVEEFRIDYYL